MMHVIQYANDVFTNHKDKWDALVLRAMTTDYSWNTSARKYENLYDKLMCIHILVRPFVCNNAGSGMKIAKKMPCGS